MKKYYTIRSVDPAPYYIYKGFYYWNMKRELDQEFDRRNESAFIYTKAHAKYLVVLGHKGYWMLWYESKNFNSK